jgi:hypothetical protein
MATYDEIIQLCENIFATAIESGYTVDEIDGFMDDAKIKYFDEE